MMIDINRIIVRNRIRKDFGDLNELADDIRQNGLINPPVVNRDFELLAGERRLRACKSLGWSQIEVRMMDTRDAEHELNVEISENENRKEFSKAERVDYMKRLLAIEQVKAREISDQNLKQNSDSQKSDTRGRADDLTAEQFGVSRDTLRKEISIVDHKDALTPEDFADWDEGKLSTNKAFQKLQESLITSRREIKFYKDRIKQLEQEPAKTVEVVPDDYEATKRKLSAAERDSARLAEDYRKARKKLMEQSKMVESLKAQLGADKVIRDAEVDIQHFTIATHDYIRRYGGHIWSFEQIRNVDEGTRADFINAIKTLDGFAQQLIRNMEGNINE